MFSPSFCKKVAQMPDWGCGAHNRGHLQSHCTCSSKKKKKGYFTSEPRYHYPDKPLKYKPFRKSKHYSKKQASSKPEYKKPRRFIKLRSTKATEKGCFLCGQPSHWAKNCPKKKKLLKVAAFCEDLDSR